MRAPDPDIVVPPPARFRSVKVAFVLAAVAASAVWAQAATAQTSARHDFPRTYHLWSCDEPDKLARYDLVVGYPRCDIARMRARNPKGIFLLQPTFQTGGSTRPLGVTYGAQEQWRGGCDTVADGSAARLGCISAFDSAWDHLRNADGSVAAAGGGYRVGGFNLADPRRRGTPDKIAKIFAYGAKQGQLYRRNWDGVHADNWVFGTIGATWFYGPRLDTDRDGSADDRRVLRRNWDSGLTRVGELLRSYLPGKIVGGNGNWMNSGMYSGSEPNGWLKTANYTLIEHLHQHGHYNDPGLFVRRARQWLDYPDPLRQERYLATLQGALACNGSHLRISREQANNPRYSLDQCVMRSMRWALTLSMFGDAYFEIYPYGLHGALWWYDEYDGGEGVRRRGFLGQPVNDPHGLSNGVWRRDFRNGVVLNNSTSSTQTVALQRTYRHIKGTQNPRLNDGSLTSTVTIPPHDGVILLGTSGVTTPPPAPPAATFSVRSSIAENARIQGAVRWEAAVSGGTVSKVEFLIDGAVRWTETTGPFVFRGNSGAWDTTREAEGKHTLGLRVFAQGRVVAESSVRVTVANRIPPPTVRPGPRLVALKPVIRRRSITIRVRAANCAPCRVRLSARSGKRLRTTLLRRTGNAYVGTLRNVPTGRWRYRILLLERPTGRSAASPWRIARIR